MKKKLSKILGVGLGLALLFAFSLSFPLATPAMADEEEWDLFDVPDEGADGDWFMGDAITGFTAFARAIDGTFYLFVDGLNDLYTSDDEGRSWEATDYATDLPGAGDIVAIAVSSEDADVLYVADTTNVYKTEDAGNSWDDLGSPVGGTEAINSLDAGYADGYPHLFAGTNDPGAGYGEVWYYHDAPFAAKWIDLDVSAPEGGGAVDNCEVWGIGVSPDFANDNLVVAIVYDGVQTESFVTANEGAGIGITAWDDLELEDDVGGNVTVAEATDPVFVDDFDINDDYELFVGVVGDAHNVSGLGGVYRITGMDETDDFLQDDVDADVASLDLVGALGGTSLLAGTTGSPASTWYSTDDGDSWDETDKAPTGEGATANLVIVDDDFADSGVAWCAADAATKEGGVHLTTDFGATWNGISMLDTDMDGDVWDIAFTADYGTGDAPLFMVTDSSVAGADDSVWKYDGTNWERVWFDDTNAINLVEVSPAYADDTTLFIADSAAPTILRSDDGSADFSGLVRQPDAPIAAWLVIDDETIITADDGSVTAGVIYKTTRYGRRTWDDISVNGNVITDLAMSPNYAADGTLLAGDDSSLVFISTDEGEEWDEVSDSDVADNTTTDADTYVVFDPRYADNDLVYVASNETIARCEIDPAEDPGDLEFDILSDTDLIDAVGTSGIVVSDDGLQVGEHVATLYVADAGAGEGVWRCLNPEDDTADVVFEQVDNGVLGTAVDFSPVSGAGAVTVIRNLELSYGSNILYAIDSAAVIQVVYTYEDTLAAPVTWLFQGGIYEGEVGDERHPMQGVTVEVYGANESYLDSSALDKLITINKPIDSTTTDKRGWYSLEVPEGYEFYYIHEINQRGYESVGATTVDGRVITSDWIAYTGSLEDMTLADNKFWDKIVVKPAPAAFTVSDLTITPTKVEIGEKVTISVLVSNTGDLGGSYKVTLKIDDVVVDTEEVMLAGGASQRVTFTTATNVAGTYSVFVDGLSDNFTVTEPTTHIIWPLVIGGVMGGAAVAGSTVMLRRSIKIRRHRQWHEKAQEEKLPETCQPCTRHCRKIELEVEPALYKITHLSLSTYNSISGERTKEKQVQGKIVDGLNRAVTAHSQGEKSKKLQEQVARLAHELLQQIIEWLHGEPAPQNVSLVAYLEGGKVTYQFILYHCKQRGNMPVWEEEDKWKADIEDKRGEPVGTLRSLDPADPKVPERLLELTGLLMQLLRKFDCPVPTVRQSDLGGQYGKGKG